MTSKQSKGKVSQKPAPGSVTGKETKLIRADRPPRYEIKDLVSVAKRLGATPKAPAEDSDGELVESKSTPAPSRIEGELLKTMVKSMFKADHPYRTKLGYYNNVATSSGGTLNFSINVNSIGNVAEWSSIDALFDECFVHSMTWLFQPYNLPGGTSASGGTLAGQVTSTTSASATLTTGVILVSLFTGSGNYTSANAMLSNPNKALRHSSQSWKYAWRNNVRFDPRGPALKDATGLSWSGWQNVSEVTNLSGNIQMRTALDQPLGDTTHVYNLGTVAVVFDVSFRSRA